MEKAPGCIAAVEEAVKPAVVAAAGVAGYATLHDGLYSTAVVSATAAAVILAREGAFERAVEYVRRAAEAAYEAAREIFEKARITLQRLYELFVEAIARALDYVRAHWFIIAATATGLITWAFAQQLDFSLWQDHIAKFAPAIAGVPAFKEVRTVLSDSAPELLRAAEEALKHRSEGAVKRLFEEAKKAVGQSSKLWAELRKVARDVERHGGRVVRSEHTAVAWALLEAGLRELSGVKDMALLALREAVEKLTNGGEVEMSTKELAEFTQRARDIAHRLVLLFEDVVKKAERYGKEEVRRAFTVTELAKKLAGASKADFGKLGEATLADKVVAFFESLAEGTTWSRVVLNALERGEAYGALIRAPSTVLKLYSAGKKEKAKDEEERLAVLISRLAHQLAERSVNKAVMGREGSVVKVIVNGETVVEAETKAVKEERGSIVYRVRGKWADEEGQKAKELVAKIEPGRAEDYELRALLATDGSYEAEKGEVQASTTSVLQTALYRRFGMEVLYTRVGNLTEDGFKPFLTAKLYRERGGGEIVETIRRDLEEGLKALLGDARLREVLRENALRLPSEIKISVHGVDEETEEGRQKVEEVRKKIVERIVKFLTELRLGENGTVCLANCQFGEPTLTYKHEAYARVLVPLIHYIAQDAPEEEIAKFLAYAVLFDGSVRRDQVYLMLGNFRVDDDTKRLPLDIYDKVTLYIILAAKYGVGVRRVYVGKDSVMLFFNTEYAAKMFSLVWGELYALWKFGKESGLYADHVFKKLEGIRKYVEEYVDKVRIEHVLHGDKVTVMFKDERGNEIAHVSIRWNGEELHAYFTGAKENAKRLTSILNALGAEVEAKEYGGKWHVELTTDSITAIRRVKWLDAVRALVEELHKRGMINEGQRNRLLTEIDAGPNVVEIADVELSVSLKERETKGRKYKWLDIIYKPRSPKAFDAAVNALRDAGFVEGVHFTAKRPEGGEQGYVRLKVPTGLWRLEELRRQGVDWAEKALKRLEEIAKARGFYDLLGEHLKPAMEAETVNPKGIVVEDAEKGIKAVIRDVRVEWEGNRPRIVVEYEVSGKAESFYFTWGVKRGDTTVKRDGTILANIKINEERALVLAALTGDEAIKGKRDVISLYASNLFALAKYKGVGWKLLQWYSEVMRE